MDYEHFPAFIADEQPLDDALSHARESLSAFGLPIPQQWDVSGFFKSLGDTLAGLNEIGASAAVEDIMLHVDYLAGKAGCASAALLRGGTFSAEQQVILDTLANIGTILRTAGGRPPEAPPDCMGAEAFDPIPAVDLDDGSICAERQFIGDATLFDIDTGTDFRAATESRLHEMPECTEAHAFAPISEIGATGESFSTEQAVILDTPGNIGGALRAAPEKPAEEPHDHIREDVFASIPRIAPDAEFVPAGPRALLVNLGNIGAVLRAVSDKPPEEPPDRFLADLFTPIREVALGGGSFTPEQGIIVDDLGDIGTVLQAASDRPPEEPIDRIPADVFASVPDVVLGGPSFAVEQHVTPHDRGDIGTGLPAAFEAQSEPASDCIPGEAFAPIPEVVGRGSVCLEQLVVSDDLGTVLQARSGNRPEQPVKDITAEMFAPILDVVLRGGAFSAEQQVVLADLGDIGTVLRAAFDKRPEQPPADIPPDVFALIEEAEAKLAGWCSREKALMIARTVLREHPLTCVEIGVFGGRSLVPCAAALRHIGAGAIYGIEAWSPNVAIENVTNEVNDAWWSKVDFACIKQEFYRFITATDLTRHVRLIEAPSGRAAALFDRIDFLHIDGSHSVVNAAEDVILYARKVRSGGIIVFDDVNWQSTAPARELLAALCDTVTVLKDPASGQDICAVLRRR